VPLSQSHRRSRYSWVRSISTTSTSTTALIASSSRPRPFRMTPRTCITTTCAPTRARWFAGQPVTLRERGAVISITICSARWSRWLPAPATAQPGVGGDGRSFNQNKMPGMVTSDRLTRTRSNPAASAHHLRAWDSGRLSHALSALRKLCAALHHSVGRTMAVIGRIGLISCAGSPTTSTARSAW